MRGRWFTILKIIIMVGAYGYLAYLLLTYDNYPALFQGLSGVNGVSWLLFAVAVLLMPVNWGMEALKWRTLVRQIQTFTIPSAFRSVLMGLASGFFTPNRVCDPVGRVLTLDSGNRAKGVMLSIVSTVAQSFAGCIFLLAAIIALPYTSFGADINLRWLTSVAVIFIVLITAIYLLLPRCRFSSIKWIARYAIITDFLRALEHIDYKVLARVSLQSILRYATYCTQYFLILRFMGVGIGVAEAFVLIPINYFLISVTPSVSFSEMGIRGAYASLLIGTATANPIGAALAAVIVWVINYILPLIAGSIFVVQYK